jgi:hypothetical protein
MEIVIVKEAMYGHNKEIITIRDKGIYYEESDGFPRLLSSNEDIIETLFTRFFSITYTWRQDYIGPRTIDGYKYLITMDINHKRKSYKIQNKFPDNWEEFINLKDSLIEGGYL